MILYCILGVGMLCFNTRLGCFESNTSAEISKHVKEFFSIFQSSVTMPFKTYKHFRTKLYKRFEHASLEILRYINKQYICILCSYNSLNIMLRELCKPDYYETHRVR